MIVNLIFNFGDLIQQIWVDFELIDEIFGFQLVAIINDKGFKALISLTLDNCFGNVLTKLKTTFNNVELFQFSSHLTKNLQITSNRKFNELFPNLKTLNLFHTRASDWTSIIIGSYPMLLSLDAELPMEKKLGGIDETEFINFFEHNKQIEEIRFRCITLKMLKAMNDALPDLDTLNIVNLIETNYLNYQGDDIHSQSIQYLNIDGNDFPLKFFFDQLEKLVLYIDTEPTENWSDFIKNQVNQNLKSFSIYLESMTKPQYLTILQSFPKLETVKIGCLKSTFEAADVLNFIEKSKFLKSLVLLIDINVDEQLKIQKSIDRVSWLIGFTPLIDNRTKLSFTR